MTLEDLRRACAEYGITITIAGYIRAAGVAKLLGVTPRALGNWRDADEGPQATQIGGNWYYSLDSLFRFFHQHEVAPLAARELRTHAHTRCVEPCSLRRRRAA